MQLDGYNMGWIVPRLTIALTRQYDSQQIKVDITDNAVKDREVKRGELISGTVLFIRISKELQLIMTY
ncbi:hypothetical protein SY85_00285 [Flavisolibacter tropicus]|uniref:Uncharacterized protein n=1 Tax=Flavisolibacter tropicus TaxID=1492898 RepID=A0A172TQ41_9BACT|nr:hypothetical protein SY85_00285 [Flavisolibacter tropicus]